MGAWIETRFSRNNRRWYDVAPRVGAWIETGEKPDPSIYRKESHPVWVRGLKLQIPANYHSMFRVAPRVGAWIETTGSATKLGSGSVAPRVGAWIETL